MPLDDALLHHAMAARERCSDLELELAQQRADFCRAVRRLHASGASLREIASSLELSHQRVHQLVEGGSWVTRLTWGSRGKKHAGGERREERFCSFCGRPQFETSKLVAGPGVWICDHCVRSATRVVTRAAASDADAMEPVPSDDLAARCNFCGRGPRRVDGLVRGGLHGRTICNRCLDLCNEVLEEDRGRVGKKRPLGQPPEPKRPQKPL